MSVYATIDELKKLGLPSAFFTNLDDPTLIEHLEKASRIVDTYLRGRYAVPLSPAPAEITRATVVIASVELLGFRGRGPNEIDLTRYQSTIKWLSDLAAGRVSLATDADPTPELSEGRARIVTSKARGW